MPKTATPRKPETVSRKLAETRNTSKNRSLSSLLGIGDNEKRLATDIGSGLNDVIGRGTIAGLLGLPGDLGGAAENGLRSLLGLPQVVPYGGSEHIGQKMEQAGLVSDVRRPKTELLASLISPTQAFTAGYKAPQMARAGVKALDNLSAPRTMGRQQGAIENLWHGSPHTFDRFDLSKIGTGEGAQDYGHGAYLAESPDVAQKHMSPIYSNSKDGNLYQTRLAWPDPAREATDPLSPDHFLHWDKPLSEQSPMVQEAIRRAEIDAPADWDGGRFYGEVSFRQGPGWESEKDLAASEKLKSLGIPGIRYLDGGSRGAGAGSHNYVVFDDKLIDIVSRNGQPVGNLGKMVAPQDEALRAAQANAAKPARGQAPKGGTEQTTNGFFYKGGQFLPSTQAEPGKWKVGKKWVTSGSELVSPGVIEAQPTPFSRSIFSMIRGFLEDAPGGGFRFRSPVDANEVFRPGVKGMLGTDEYSRAQLLDEYNKGNRWINLNFDEPTLTSIKFEANKP